MINYKEFFLYIPNSNNLIDFLMVFPLKKKGLLMMSHVFKVKGIWHMNDIKIIQITWLLHVNWFLQNLFINLQFAQNNSSIVQNSNTTTNKENKKFQDLNFQSLWMFQKMIKDLLKLENITGLVIVLCFHSGNENFPLNQLLTGYFYLCIWHVHKL